MRRNYNPALKTETADDAIEPEIISGPARGADSGHRAESAMARFRAFIFKLKLLFSAAIGLVALALLITGAVLTSTVIGAVLGIPLILAGAFLIRALFRMLTLGNGKKFFVFRHF